MKTVVARISEVRLFYLIPFLRFLELRFDPIETTTFDPTACKAKRIAVSCFGFSKPVLLATEASAILDKKGVPMWDYYELQRAS